jgi:WD40 repeat protein
MAEVAQPIIMISTPVRAFEVHECTVSAVAVFPDRRLMVTGLGDNTLCLWDLTNGVVLKKMEGHQSWVGAVAVSRDGRLIASGDANGKLIAWDGNTGEFLSDIDVHPARSSDFSLPKPFAIDSDGHSAWVSSLDFSPGGALASGSGDKTTRLWSTETWRPQGKINCDASVHCVRHSPSGEYLAIATDENIQIWTPGRMEFIVKFKAHSTFNLSWNYSLAWTPDGTRLLSAGSDTDPTIREWETSAWEQVGNPWKGHTALVTAIAVDSTGTFVASASHDHHVHLWRLSDRKTIASFKHFDEVNSVTFSMDGKHVLSAGKDQMISEWAVPEDYSPDSKAHFYPSLLAMQ